MNIPKKIEICPIIDSVVELRFISSIFPNAVFGLVLKALQPQYPKVEKLPILQLPEQLRDADPNFKYKAHYKITSDDGYSVQIGPDVIVIGAPIPYQGWDEFSKNIYFVIGEVLNAGVINIVTRLGLRFINFFERNIFNSINVNLSINDKPIYPRNTLLRTEIIEGDFHNTLQIANNATRIVNNQQVIGSIIDIDSFKSYEDIHFQSIYRPEIELAHKTEKEIFFKLLAKDFLETLKPIY
jgi:uncharacterized protein (TIGR04255 family)